jgi:L-fucose mutarotase/ribose pyranase (RbsD/FucU family)
MKIVKMKIQKKKGEKKKNQKLSQQRNKKLRRLMIQRKAYYESGKSTYFLFISSSSVIRKKTILALPKFTFLIITTQMISWSGSYSH